VISAGAVILGQFLLNSPNYGPELRYSLTRIPLRNDYSCDQNVYGLYLVLNNSGPKTVEGLSIVLTNELCVGAIPTIPASLSPGNSLKVYLYSTAGNGTITISGNQTQLNIQF
jgi:hypothetical protein